MAPLGRGHPEKGVDVARDRGVQASPPEQVISIIGPGMRIQGDCDTDGAVRIEGMVEGNVRAGKAVVVGKEGRIRGDIFTQDAVISGSVEGSIHAESRLELQGSSQIAGEILAGRMVLEEGAILNGTVRMGEEAAQGSAEEVELPPPPGPSREV
jgi:cytoskeletal protein CcmA (bactofilin family)